MSLCKEHMARLDEYEEQRKRILERHHRAKHVVIRECCPYKIGTDTVITGLLNNGKTIRIDEVELMRHRLYNYQWCWILRGRVVGKASKLVGKMRAAAVVPVMEQDDESDITQHQASEGAGV